MAQASFVAFVVAGVRYAVPIAHVKEVLRPLPHSALARMPKAVLGVADFRGAIAVVLELREHLGAEPRSPHARALWIVLEVERLLLALVVDEMLGVVEEDVSRLAPMPAPARHDVVAAVPRDGKLIFVLDLERLFEIGDEALMA